MKHSPLASRFAPLVLTILLFSSIPSPVGAVGVTLELHQSGEVKAMGAWTILQPDQKQLKGNADSQSFQDLPAGRYTIFDEPPAGTVAELVLTKNGTVVETVTYPQISFDVAEGDAIVLTIRHTLTNVGKVGVSSDPSGIPFELRGPNNLIETGVTPATFDRQPIGNYSVKYVPDGCPAPPAKSDALKKDANVYFSVTIRCDTLKKPETTASENVQFSTEEEGPMLTFTDVRQDAWYAPFVASVARGGILTGYRDDKGDPTGEFGPDNPVTVAELAKIVHEVAGIDVKAVTVAPHNEQAIGKWFTRYVASAEDLGWALFLDEHLDLYRPVTRAEVMVTFLQMLDIPLHWQKGSVFKDVTRRTSHAAAVETAYEHGLISGSTDEDGNPTGYVQPDASMNRAEMAKFLITVQNVMRARKAASSSSL